MYGRHKPPLFQNETSFQMDQIVFIWLTCLQEAFFFFCRLGFCSDYSICVYCWRRRDVYSSPVLLWRRPESPGGSRWEGWQAQRYHPSLEGEFKKRELLLQAMQLIWPLTFELWWLMIFYRVNGCLNWRKQNIEMLKVDNMYWSLMTIKQPANGKSNAIRLCKCTDHYFLPETLQYVSKLNCPLCSHWPVLMAMARPLTEETVKAPSSEQMLM